MSETTGKPAAAKADKPSRTSVEVVDEYLRCIREQDRSGLREVLSAHIEVRYFGPKDALPWAGVFRGLRGFDRFARTVVEHLEILEAAEVERIADEGRVVIVGRARWRVRASQREFRARVITIFGIETGRIASYHVYTDTAAFVRALRG